MTISKLKDLIGLKVVFKVEYDRYDVDDVDAVSSTGVVTPAMGKYEVVSTQVAVEF